MSTTEPSEAPQRTLNEHHQDPNADVIIISNDNMEFRASSYYLTKESKFFEDLLSLPPPSVKKREPINLDFDSLTIRSFLDLIITPVYLRGRVLDFLDLTDLISLLEMVEFTLCNKLISVVRKALINYPNTGTDHLAYNLMYLASKREDKEFTRAGIKNLDDLVIPKLCGASSREGQCEGKSGNVPFEDRCRGKLFDFEEWFAPFRLLPPASQFELFHLMVLKLENLEEGATKGKLDKDVWKWISEKFDPNVPLCEKVEERKRRFQSHPWLKMKGLGSEWCLNRSVGKLLEGVA